jgi:hypothetical protein
MSMYNDGGIILTGENRRYRGKTCPSATLSIINPTRIDPGANLGLRGKRPATNSLGHVKAHERMYSSYSFTTSALQGMSGHRHAPAEHYPPGNSYWYCLIFFPKSTLYSRRTSYYINNFSPHPRFETLNTMRLTPIFIKQGAVFHFRSPRSRVLTNC